MTNKLLFMLRQQENFDRFFLGIQPNGQPVRNEFFTAV
jgi:hypothetical protein